VSLDFRKSTIAPLSAPVNIVQLVETGTPSRVSEVGEVDCVVEVGHTGESIQAGQRLHGQSFRGIAVAADLYHWMQFGRAWHAGHLDELSVTFQNA